VEVTEVEAGLGQEALQEAGPVLHPPEPRLTSAVSWPMSCLTRLASDRFRFDQTGWPDRDTHDSMMPIVASESDLIPRVLVVHRPQDEAKALRHAAADRLRSCPDLSEGRVTVILCARPRGGM
jgi:hypothetical protein